MVTLKIQEPEQLWNSLELVKLVISTLTPIIIAIIAFRFNKILKRLDKKQWTNQKIVEKRIEIYDKIVPKLNDILCFYCYVGNWKDISPVEIVNLKRTLDKDINIYSPLFSYSLLQNYNEFIHLCFSSFTGWGNNAKIRSLFGHIIEHGSEWKPDWEVCFDTTEVIEPSILRKKYTEFMEIFQTGYYTDGTVPTANFK